MSCGGSWSTYTSATFRHPRVSSNLHMYCSILPITSIPCFSPMLERLFTDLKTLFKFSRCSYFPFMCYFYYLLLSDCHFNAVFYRNKKKKKKTLKQYALNSLYSKWGREISRDGTSEEWIAKTSCLNCCINDEFLHWIEFDLFHGKLGYGYKHLP